MPNPRIPNRLKRLRGTNRADRNIVAKAGDRIAEPPEAPDTLSDGARKEWEALAPVLVELGTICKGDLRAFEQLCETLATANALQAIIEDEGVLLKTGADGFKANPAQKSLETARAQAMRLYSEFGITPKARNYVSAAPKPREPSPWDDDFVDPDDDEPRGFQYLPR